MKDWGSILDHLPLRSEERIVARKFLEQPAGLLFVKVAEIFRIHGHTEECIAILSWGLQTHPSFGAARVKLAGELFQKGLIQESWDCLRRSPTSLAQNIIAQKLQFKCSILLGFESYARSIIEGMYDQDFLDAGLAKLRTIFKSQGFFQARDFLKKQLIHDGINPIVEEVDPGKLSGSLELFSIRATDGDVIYLREDPSHYNFFISSLDVIFRRDHHSEKNGSNVLS